MDIVIIFATLRLSDISKEGKELIQEELISCSNAVFSPDGEVKVLLCEGTLSNANDAMMIIKVRSIGVNASGKLKILKEKLVKVLETAVNKTCTVLAKVDPEFELPAQRVDGADEKKSDTEFDYEERSKLYVPTDPAYSFDRVILPDEVLEKIEEALSILEYEDKVFQEWGLSVIQPHPSSALSFYGPSGTGKTMAAEAIAQKLGKKILKVSYADIESKFHGEGPKMVKAIFFAAAKEDAVLFIDEADSLLSKRLTNVTQGSEQAINSMRSQLLICLEEFKGIVIFATNLVINYDQAFLTRLISVKFVEPDEACRKKIWNVHLRPTESAGTQKLKIPLDETVNTDELAEKYSFCGREIRTVVISACVKAAMEHRERVTQADLILAADKVVKERENLKNAKDGTVARVENLLLEKTSVSESSKEALKEALRNKMKGEGNE